jgi:lysozyme
MGAAKPYGIDVSHHQSPGALPWARIAQRSSFAIVRGSYGTMRDRATVEHVRRARGAGLRVGLYHFYRPSQPVKDQLAVFRAQLEAASISVGDVVPAIDVELDPFPKETPVTPAWQGSILEFVDAMVSDFGDCMVYITQREFNMLGAPAWLLSRPLWVAHYTGAAKPATPGNKSATIWQHRVGPYDPDGAGGYVKERPELDQNRLLGTLPLIGAGVPSPAEPLPPELDDGHDEGLEELIAHVNAGSWERAQDAVGMAGQNLREHESIEEERLSDTDPHELAPESERQS